MATATGRPAAADKLNELQEELEGQSYGEIVKDTPLGAALTADDCVHIGANLADIEWIQSLPEDRIMIALERGIAIGIRFAYEMEKEAKATAAGA